jgi:aerobic carbon-monoxide dehydrogenase small subunit
MTSATVILNGRSVCAEIEPRMHLADFIREHAGLTGTHLGCEHGVCGACTVEIDGEIARSCITFAVACGGASIRTIEGFETDALMIRLRKAFMEEHALQCGYCTPGMLIAARDLVKRGAVRTESEIRVAMSGNLCRCTGYAGIVAAIKRVVDEDTSSGAAIEVEHAQTFGLGPAGSHSKSAAAEFVRFEQERPAKAGLAQDATASPSSRPHIKVTTDAPVERAGLTVLSQRFGLPHPVEAVWARMRDLDQLIPCLPGASLDRVPDADGHFSGSMTIAFGPISPSFKGSGTFSVSDADYSGHLRGTGQDARAGARAAGEMQFRLKPAGAAGTLVEAEIGYKLTGALAQFGRPSLVRSVVTEVGSIFATNLDRVLAGEEAGGTAATKGLRVAVILRAIVLNWVSALRRLLKHYRFWFRQKR